MEEIKVGEYVRTKYTGITKIVKKVYFEGTNKIRYYLDDKNYSIFPELLKPNHSKNIIDLIEVGDYVNGSRVVDIMEDMQTGELHLEMTYNYTNEEKGDCTIYNKDIKSIVTKEQYSQIEYRLED